MKKKFKINSNKKVDKGTRLAWSLLITYLTVAGDLAWISSDYFESLLLPQPTSESTGP